MKRTTSKVPDYPVTMGRTGLMNINKIVVGDMVWGMVNLRRFTGKSDRDVTNAVHSRHCYEIAKKWQPENYALQLYCLVHDFPEAYYGDFPGFLKVKLGAEFEYAIKEIDSIILNQLGLEDKTTIVLHDDMKKVDSTALALEACYAFSEFEPYHWPPAELYKSTDIVETLSSGYDSVGMYNLILDGLDDMARYNTTLEALLESQIAYPHPQRNRIGPCVGHAFQVA